MATRYDNFIDQMQKFVFLIFADKDFADDTRNTWMEIWLYWVTFSEISSNVLRLLYRTRSREDFTKQFLLKGASKGRNKEKF